MINYRSSCKVKLIKWQNPARNLVNNLWYYSPIWFKFWVNNSIHKNCETIKKFTRLSRKIKWSNMRFWSAVLSTTNFPSLPVLLSILSSFNFFLLHSRNFKIRETRWDFFCNNTWCQNWIFPNKITGCEICCIFLTITFINVALHTKIYIFILKQITTQKTPWGNTIQQIVIPFTNFHDKKIKCLAP